MLRPFDIDDRKRADVLSEAEKALQELADELDLDAQAVTKEADVDDDEGDDDLDGWLDECVLLPGEMLDKLAQDVHPVKMTLAKVSIAQ